LKELRKLTILGCSRVTNEGVYAILREAGYLEELSVDAAYRSVRAIDPMERFELIESAWRT
jgi:hypothetical protein